MTKCPKCESKKVKLLRVNCGCVVGKFFSYYECEDCNRNFHTSNVKGK